MRVAIISDIHGNCVALDAVWNDIKKVGVDSVVCLGDAVQCGPQPTEVVAQLRQLGCPVVMCNCLPLSTIPAADHLQHPRWQSMGNNPSRRIYVKKG